MSSQATHSSTPHSASEDAQPHAGEHPLAHPKIARRPTQWKRTLPVPGAPAANTAPKPPAVRLAWQDDMRFGIWLVVVVVALNIVLMRLDDRPGNHLPKPSIMVQQLTRASVLPTQLSAENPKIRMFATPEDERRTTRETIHDLGSGELISDDMDSPAPRASQIEYDDEQ